MNYYYVSLYILVCFIIFLFLFMPYKLFNFLFEKVYNGITDYNDPKFTGGYYFIFNPLRHLKNIF